MIVANGSSGNETHTAAIEERSVAAGACAYKKRTGFPYIVRHYIRSSFCHHLVPHSLKRIAQIRYLFVDAKIISF